MRVPHVGPEMDMLQRPVRLSMVALMAGMMFAQSSKIAPDLAQDQGSDVEVIVQYRRTPTDEHHRFVRQHGGVLRTTMDFMRAAHYSVPANAIKSLAADPDVAYISPNRQVSGMLDVTAPSVNATIARQYGWTGKGIGIAIIDSGISDDP